MARPQSHQHVRRRRALLFAAGPAAETAGKSGGKMCCRGRDNHRGGIGSWLGGKPTVSGVGLPANAVELSGADLPALQPAVDAGELWGDAAAPIPGAKTQVFRVEKLGKSYSLVLPFMI